MKQLISTLVFFCITIVLVSCASIGNKKYGTGTVHPPKTESPYPSRTHTATPTIVTPTRTPTVAPPSPTVVSLTTTNTPRPTRSVTKTLPPILELETETTETTSQQLVKETPECSSPCALGIVPGNRVKDAESILSSLGLAWHLTNTRDHREFYQTSYQIDGGIPINFVFTIQDGVIKTIDGGSDLQQYEEQEVQNTWATTYASGILISRFGPPAKVSFFTSDFPSEAGTIEYHMIMNFEALDFIVEYRYGEIKLGELMQTCPQTDHFSGVHLWLGKNPDDIIWHMEQMLPRNPPFSLHRKRDIR